MDKLTVLISTLNGGINKLQKTVVQKNDILQYIVIQQISDNKKYEIPYFLQRKDIEVIQILGSGLSKSRNAAIKNCKTKFALLADDDLEYPNNFFEKILSKFRQNSDLVLAVFQIKTPDNEPSYKDYPKISHNLKEKMHWLSSVEIAFDVEKIRAAKIKFDERFGLCAKITQGEEHIFVNDVINNNLQAVYFPEEIVLHAFESSGKRNFPSKKYYFYQGAIQSRTNSVKKFPKQINRFYYFCKGILYEKLTRKSQ
ncbi:MAG: glycosyltransferase [Prevotellaceae bacterium]|jgi:glycosyltransferase involved in cell wall biosynthesis|nr:glycosyltransferase [Prevotellaceae bacterium]